MGVAERGGCHVGGHHSTVRPDSAVRARRTAPARRGGWELLSVSVLWGHGRCPLKQRWRAATTAAHGASAEGGWVRLSMSVLRGYSPPPAQAAWTSL